MHRILGIVLLCSLAQLAGASDALHNEYPSVLKEDGVYKMWYSGYGYDAESVAAWRIFYATSTDGVQWTKHGVVLDKGAPDSWEKYGVAFPSVIRRGARYMMWYGGQGGETTRYAIGLATSFDGIHWTRHPSNPVLTGEPPSKVRGFHAADPSVIYDEKKKRFFMWYNEFGFVNAYSMATSVDGIRWKKYRRNPVLKAGRWGSWDSANLYTLSVLKDGPVYRMWYAVGLNGHAGSLGMATSPDGIRWTKSEANPFSIGPVTGTDWWNNFGQFYYGACVIRDGDELKMWVNGIGGVNVLYGSIAHAVSTDGIVWEKRGTNPVLCPPEWSQPRVEARKAE